MKNIFEGAKFGDKFLTRDGALAIFIDIIHSKNNNFNRDFARLIDDITHKVQYYFLDGSKILGEKHDCDIVSKYQETIVEEKLDELAEEKSFEYEGLSSTQFIDGFKAGYHKAKEK